jgi:hypothetical protein
MAIVCARYSQPPVQKAFPLISWITQRDIDRFDITSLVNLRRIDITRNGIKLHFIGGKLFQQWQQLLSFLNVGIQPSRFRVSRQNYWHPVMDGFQ